MTIILSEQACDELWQAQEPTVQSDPLDPLDVTYRCPPVLGLTGVGFLHQEELGA
jgi:hypothetical protein